MTAGALLVFLSYLKTAFRPMKNMAKYAGRISKAAASAERIVEVLDTTPEITNRPDAVDVPPVLAQLNFDGVEFGYEPAQVALDSVSLQAHRGQVIVWDAQGQQGVWKGGPTRKRCTVSG